MASGLTSLFEFGIDILKTFVDSTTKTILAQVGSVQSDTSDSDRVMWWQHVGFASRPAKASSKNTAAQAVVVRGGAYDNVIASRDLRGQDLYGQLSDGETCLYASGEDGTAQARVLLKGDGSINLYTRKGNSSSGQGMGIFVNAEADSISIINSQGYGLLIKSDGVYLTARDAALSLTASGNVSLVGKGNTQVDGAGVVIGSLAVPGVNSALTGVTGVAGKASLKVLIE